MIMAPYSSVAAILGQLIDAHRILLKTWDLTPDSGRAW
jgi:hypothetical protein